MTALPTLLTGTGAHAGVRNVLEGIEVHQMGVRPDVAPHSIYEELWHLVYWQDLILGWADGADTPAPATAAEGWPAQPAPQGLSEARDLVRAFLTGVNRAVALAGDADRLDRPARKGTVRSLLESLLAHNAYHLGRIVLLRQLIGIWPPPSGGDTW